MRRVSQQEWENEHMHNPMTEGEALAVLPDYDAGLLNDYGGGNVEWWQDYLRAEIGRANDYWRENITALTAAQQPVQEGGGARLTNPWTGEPRDYRDVNSDPAGTLCVEPGAPLKAAPPSAPVGVEQETERVKNLRAIATEAEHLSEAAARACDDVEKEHQACRAIAARNLITQQPAQAAPLPASEFVGATARVRDCNCRRYDGRNCRKCFRPPYPDEATPPGDDAAGERRDDLDDQDDMGLEAWLGDRS